MSFRGNHSVRQSGWDVFRSVVAELLFLAGVALLCAAGHLFATRAVLSVALAIPGLVIVSFGAPSLAGDRASNRGVILLVGVIAAALVFVCIALCL